MNKKKYDISIIYQKATEKNLPPLFTYLNKTFIIKKKDNIIGCSACYFNKIEDCAVNPHSIFKNCSYGFYLSSFPLLDMFSLIEDKKC